MDDTEEEHRIVTVTVTRTQNVEVTEKMRVAVTLNPGDDADTDEIRRRAVKFAEAYDGLGGEGDRWTDEVRKPASRYARAEYEGEVLDAEGKPVSNDKPQAPPRPEIAPLVAVPEAAAPQE